MAAPNQRSTPPQLTAADIKPGRCFEAKRPKKYSTLDGTFYDDRQVSWVSSDLSRIQYDSPTVRNGRRFPTTDMEKFLKWVGRDVEHHGRHFVGHLIRWL